MAVLAPLSPAQRADVQNLISQARSAAPEFAADVIITLVESGAIAEHRLQRELLQEAFGIAANAQERIALKRGAGDSPVTAALHGAFRRGIDSASLRSRAVQAMLRLDPRLAREMFERIDLPIEPAYGCEQQIVPDLTIYYVTMFEVARTIPDSAQLEAFFDAHMPRVRSTAQITPLIRVFLQIRGIEHMPAVIDAFSSRFGSLQLDRRVFSTYFDETMEAIGQLVSTAAPSAREKLVQRSHDWAVRNINYGVCSETQKWVIGFDGSRHPAGVADPAARFNEEVAWRARNARIDFGVATRDTAAGVNGNSPEYTDFFRTHLMLAKDDDGALDPSRWRSEMENYIDRLRAWTWGSQVESKIVSFRDIEGESLSNDSRSLNEARPSGSALVAFNESHPDARNFFLEKSDLLNQVLFIDRHAPAAPAASSGGRVQINWYGAPKQEGPRLAIPGRDRVLSGLVATFESDAARKVYEDRRVLWFSPVRDLLSIPGVASLYALSKDPVLSLYGRLAELVALK